MDLTAAVIALIDTKDELHWMMMDEAALMLIIWMDMTTEEMAKDAELRKERIERTNRLLDKAITLVRQMLFRIPDTSGKLPYPTSARNPEDEQVSLTLIGRGERDQAEEVMLRQQESRERPISPEPSKRPPYTPHDEPRQMKKSISFGLNRPKIGELWMNQAQ